MRDVVKNIKERIPHIFLIDINLGKTTGVECSRLIQSIPQLLPIPKILMSIYASRLQIDESEQIGCHYYFEKPPSFLERVDEMKKLFEKDWECN
ncbi:hypothetical protein SAE01_45840 [Segetibacter aerophilus]|uniref:Response regulatory domain-containing protein n=1 Tax=Segetibacter aerophilus TaxID=670293 RepID=A0A512BJE6_9BACT|nr:hypothetical protein SAE01_45840 [Segetibacter aerophilus]